MSDIDLDSPPPNHEFDISIKREEFASDRRVRQFKDVVLFLVAVGFVITIAGISIHTLYSPAASADEKKWAMSLLTGAGGALIGYLVHK
jgi:hypothetical protein